MKDCRTLWGFPQIDSAVVDCGAVELDDRIFRRTSFPPHKFSAGRDSDYIWLAMLTGLSVRTRSVTGSLSFGSRQRLLRSCLWLAVFYRRWIENADVPLCRHLVSAVGRTASYELDMFLYVPLCRHLLSLDPTVCRNVSHEIEMYFLPPCFRLILTISYCTYRFFRERDIASGRSPDRDLLGPFHAPTRWAKLYDFAPDIQDAMELRALRPHAKLVKVISVWNSRGSRMMTPSDLAPCG